MFFTNFESSLFHFSLYVFSRAFRRLTDSLPDKTLIFTIKNLPTACFCYRLLESTFFHHHDFQGKHRINSMYLPFPACPFGVAGPAARVGISKHPDLLRLAVISLVEFQDVTKRGLQHNSASQFRVTQAFCHSEEHP